jgi:tetratricopeptide (TPR) repeat protein
MDLRTHLNYGCSSPVLPYTMQDDYGAGMAAQDHPAIVLENEILRATFLPGLGGRLWSLHHKPSGRELLYVNSVFRPRNLAVRNAWFSGGVEWNVGIRGHSPFTCSPVFAQRDERPDGTPVLRMFEFERVRRVPWVIECSLPEGSPFLLVRVHLFNPHRETIPMYWWSNIAVPEAPGHRVLAPADHCLHYGYAGCLKHLPFPLHDGGDTSYPTKHRLPADFFFDIPAGRRRWITSLDPEGKGLVQCSTARQQGRKMFTWGMGDGGRRWQRFLTDREAPYLELQAGLARSQYECLPMPPDTHWHWTEAYGLLDGYPGVVHSPDWPAATRHLEERLEQLLPAADLERQDELTTDWENASRAPFLYRGSGWGALETRRMIHEGQPSSGVMCLFPEDSLKDAQRPWADLLENQRFAPVSVTPVGYQTDQFWDERLREALAHPETDRAAAWYHRGVASWVDGDRDKARVAWETSLDLEPTSATSFALGVLEEDASGPAAAAEHYARAVRLAPNDPVLVLAHVACLLEVEGPASAAAFIDGHTTLQNHPRIQLLRHQALLRIGKLDEVDAWLRGHPVLPDMREGEQTLTDLWDELQSLRGTSEPAPPEIDFRMRCHEKSSYETPAPTPRPPDGSGTRWRGHRSSPPHPRDAVSMDTGRRGSVRT